MDAIDILIWLAIIGVVGWLVVRIYTLVKDLWLIRQIEQAEKAATEEFYKTEIKRLQNEKEGENKQQTVSEQMQDELEPIIHSHPTEHDESDDLEMVKAIKEKEKEKMRQKKNNV